MHLKKLSICNYRLFEKIDIPFHKNLTVLTGDNSSGKTSILEAAAIALGTMFTKIDGVPGVNILESDARILPSPTKYPDNPQTAYPVRITAGGVVEGKEVEWTRELRRQKGITNGRETGGIINVSKDIQQRLQEGDESFVLPIIAYYGTGRLSESRQKKRKSTIKENVKINGYADSLMGAINIEPITNWFKRASLESLQRQKICDTENLEQEAVFDTIRTFLSSIMDFSNVNFNYSIDIDELIICYTDRNGFRFRTPLSQFGGGYRCALMLIMDIAYRMAMLNPHLSSNVLRKTNGVVLIDEIELHLHPQYQKRIISVLTKFFPRVQFIVSTYSPIIVNSVHSENLIVLKNRQVLNINNQVYGKDVKSILSEFMNTDERPDEIAILFKEFHLELSTGNLGKAENILNRIDELRGFHDPEVANYRVRLKMLHIHNGV